MKVLAINATYRQHGTTVSLVEKALEGAAGFSPRRIAIQKNPTVPK